MSRDRLENLILFGNRLHRDSSRTLYERRRVPVTVCVAALFSYNYALPGSPPQWGSAAIMASDEMITVGDIQYESSQQKVAVLASKSLLMIAGDYAIHSEAIQGTVSQLKGKAEPHPQKIALIYGQEIQKVKRRHAEDVILAPLGMNTDTFLAQMKDMTDSFANEIKEQLQRFSGHSVEAIIVGSDGDAVHMYEVDSRGSVSCMDDVQFHAIGAGAWHAKSHLMQAGYARTFTNLATAMAQTYTAKRRAELAPGVGKPTDMHLVLKDQWYPISRADIAKLDELYAEYTSQQSALALETVAKLQEHLNAIGPKNAAIGIAGDSEADGEAGELASPTAQGNEATEEAAARPHILGQEKGAA